MIRRIARLGVALLAAIGVVGCYNHRLDTFEKHCDHLMDVSLKKYEPFWSVFTIVSFHNDQVLDSLVASLNATYMKKFEGRIDRAVWREGSPAAGVLHVTNLSGLFEIEPEPFIEGWRQGIEKELARKSPMQVGDCLFAEVTLMFDALHVHSTKGDLRHPVDR